MRISLDDVTFIGDDLHRPECVLCTRGGDLFTADWRGGITRIRPDGSQHLIRADLPDPPLQPNGIALLRDGSFLLADISDTRAGVWRLNPDGHTEPFLLEVAAQPLPPVNFVCLDRQERIWITVSTRKQPRALDYRPTANSGFIVLVDQHGARIVADGLGYTNECIVTPDGETLYVNETFARRLTRFRIRPDGSLTNRSTVATFEAGTFPDGLALDTEGGLWVTSIVSNRILRMDAEGAITLVLEDADPEHLAYVEDAFQSGTMDRPHLDTVRSQKLKNISSLAFGGEDLRTAVLGCLLGNRLATVRLPIAGLPPVHWNYKHEN